MNYQGIVGEFHGVWSGSVMQAVDCCLMCHDIIVSLAHANQMPCHCKALLITCLTEIGISRPSAVSSTGPYSY